MPLASSVILTSTCITMCLYFLEMSKLNAFRVQFKNAVSCYFYGSTKHYYLLDIIYYFLDSSCIVTMSCKHNWPVPLGHVIVKCSLEVGIWRAKSSNRAKLIAFILCCSVNYYVILYCVLNFYQVLRVTVNLNVTYLDN